MCVQLSPCFQLSSCVFTVTRARYMPILPTVLVNGAEGIGTGWSTSIPNFNPHDIVKNIKRLMNGEEQVRCRSLQVYKVEL